MRKRDVLAVTAAAVAFVGGTYGARENIKADVGTSHQPGSPEPEMVEHASPQPDALPRYKEVGAHMVKGAQEVDAATLLNQGEVVLKVNF